MHISPVLVRVFFTTEPPGKPLCCPVAQSCPTVYDPTDYSMPGLPVLHRLAEFAQTHAHWVGDIIQPSHPLSSPSPSFPALGSFLMSTPRIRWPQYWSFRISPSNEYLGLISFSIDWFYFLAVQGTLRSLLQHHSSKAWILWCSAFFMVQLSHLYMTPGKNHIHSLDNTALCQQSNVSAF